MRTAVIMGSTSDLPKVEPAVEILKSYGVQVDVRCLSAHRAHAGLSAFMEETNRNGTEVIITAAGMAAALPGVVASQTVLPVIGVPLSGSVLDGMDALYCSDAFRHSGCNSGHQWKQKCSLSCTSDYGSPSSGTERAAARRAKGNGRKCHEGK